MSATGLGADELQALTQTAAREGLLRLSAVRLDHPGFAAAHVALDEYLAHGRAGEMAFMQRAADVRKDPSKMLPGARTYLVALVPYGGESGPVARYARSSDYHTEIHHRLEHVVAHLVRLRPEAATMICVDTKPVLERSAAALAGLGFLGKNGMLITPGLGSYVLLGGVLTDVALAVDDAVADLSKATWEACGSCTRCLDACPTDAFVGPGRLDARRCISYLTIEHRGEVDDALADATGERIAGCDVCQEVCPYNAGRNREARVPAAAWLPEPGGKAADASDLAALVNVRSSPYRAFVRRTALRRIPRVHMRRNVLIALGNRVGPLTADEGAAVDEACGDDDPQIRRWAERVRRRRG